MDGKNLIARLRFAYAEHERSTQVLADAAEVLIYHERCLADAKFGAILDGKIVGKNAEEREARAAVLLEVPECRVRDCKRDFAQAKTDHTLTQLAIDLLKTELRILELCGPDALDSDPLLANDEPTGDEDDELPF